VKGDTAGDPSAGAVAAVLVPNELPAPRKDPMLAGCKEDEDTPGALAGCKEDEETPGALLRAPP
jgi:hypothetical protein